MNSAITTSAGPLREWSFRKLTLANGLDLIVRKQTHAPIVAVNLWYHVGSKNEERSQRGYAHLFEHLMFEGSQHYPGDFFKPLQRVGAGVNGSTSPDRTNYYVDIPKAHLELAVAMESDRMANLLPALSDDKLRVQKDVVKNEYRQNYANRPYGQAWRLLAEALYPPDHPYSWPTIGVMEDVEAATPAHVEAFFRRFYVPMNASLCFVGDLDEDDTIALAERYFGPIPGGAQPRPFWARSVALSQTHTLCAHDRVELDRFYLAWHTPAHFTEADATLTLLADLLARGRASRLHRLLVVEHQLAQDVSAYQSGRELSGTFGVVVTLRPNKSIDRTLALVDETIRQIAERGPTCEELERALNGRVAGFIYALDNVGGFGGVADRMNAYNTFLGDPSRLIGDLDRFRAVTVEDVRTLARLHLADQPRVELIVSKQTPPVTGLIDRSVRPASRPVAAFQPPLPERLELRNGVSLWVLPRRELPFITASAALARGASAHAPKLGGLANLLAAMLDEGTHRRTAHQIALEVEQYGSSLSAVAGWDGTYVSLQCLTDFQAAGFDLACDVLHNATFPDAEWPRVHAQVLAGLRAERESAESLAHRALLRAIYPPNHPFRVPIDGLESTVESISREMLETTYRRHLAASPLAWIVAGDVDGDAVARLIEAHTPEGLRQEVETQPRLDVLERRSESRMIVVDRPGAPQAVVRIGHVGIARSDPDYDSLLLWNQVLGGQFSSRLNETLREKKGYTYGIRSHFEARRDAGPFCIGASLQADRLADALRDLQAEVSALLNDRPPSALELDDARQAIIESQARQFETPGALVSRYASVFVHDLPVDEYVRLAERLISVDLDTVIQAGHAHVDPGRFVYVIVADAEQVTTQLQQLGWTSVEHLDPIELTRID